MAGPEDTAADDGAGAPGPAASGVPFGPPPSLGPASFGPPPAPAFTAPPPPPGSDAGPDAVAPSPGGDFFSGYGYSATIPAPARPRRRRLTAGLAAAGATVVLATSLVVVLGSGPDAQAAVLNAVNSTLAGKTAHLTLSMTASAGGASITASGTGSADFGRDAMALNTSMSAAGQQVALSEVIVGGTLYESIPGIDLIERGKSWVSADVSQFAQSATSGTGGALGASDDPLATLHMLAQQGNTVTPLGASDVDGVAVQGYAVTIDKGAIEKDLSGASIPSWLRQSLSGLDFSGFNVRVYVDDQGQLRREAVDVAMSVESQALSAHATIDFSDYGTPVDVSAPPADQVVSLQQFLQDAGAVQGGFGS